MRGWVELESHVVWVEMCTQAATHAWSLADAWIPNKFAMKSMDRNKTPLFEQKLWRTLWLTQPWTKALQTN